MREAEREVAELLGETPVAEPPKKASTRSDFMNQFQHGPLGFDLYKPSFLMALREAGLHGQLSWEYMIAYNRVMLRYADGTDVFIRAYDYPRGDEKPGAHPLFRFLGELVDHSRRDENEARDVYQDPHIVRL